MDRENALPQVGGLVLAGGLGRRMAQETNPHQVNKGLVPFRGRPLVTYPLKALKPAVDFLAISANHDLLHYQEFGYSVFKDLPDYQAIGPLGGLYSAATQFPKSIRYIIVAPCDTPFLPDTYAPTLLKTMIKPPAKSDNSHAYFVATPKKNHYTLAIYTREALLTLPHYLAQNRSYRLQDFLTYLEATPLYFDSEHYFYNINDQETLKKYS